MSNKSYKWKLNKDFGFSEKMIAEIKPNAIVDFNISVVRELGHQELRRFRERLWGLIHLLRDKKVSINYESLRLQSIMYNVLLLGPQTLQLNISNKCNYRCKFCIPHSIFTSTEYAASSVYFMPFENIRNIIDQAYMLGTEIIYVCGGGEPLLHPKILRVLTYIGKYDFKIIILTNASIFRVISRILELPRSLKLSFVVNLSAADAEKFASIYGKKPSMFVQLLENIKNINRRHPVLLSYLIFKDTYNDIFKFIKLAHSLNITMIRLKFPILYNVKQREMLLSDKEMNILLHSLMELKGFSEKYGVDVEFKKYIINYYLEKTKKAKVDKCYNGWFFAKIKVNGDIYLCCKENKFLGRASSGNFKEVFFSPAYVAYVLQGKRGINIHSKDWKKCRFCLECERNVSLSRILK